MTTEKILNIKVGDVFIEGKNYPVFKTAFKKVSKKGETYYESREPVFIQEFTKRETVQSEKVKDI